MPAATSNRARQSGVPMLRLGRFLRHLAPQNDGSCSSHALARSPLQPSLVRRRGPVELPNGEMFESWSRPWTTRPELSGKVGMVASSESLASIATGRRVIQTPLSIFH